MMMDELESLKGQRVELSYNGIWYSGLLSGASESEIFLKTDTDWLSLPMEEVREIRRAPERAGGEWSAPDSPTSFDPNV